MSYRNHFDLQFKLTEWFLYEMQHWAQMGYVTFMRILQYHCNLKKPFEIPARILIPLSTNPTKVVGNSPRNV